MNALVEPVGALSVGEAQQALASAQSCWHARDVDGLVALLHPDVRIRFNDAPELQGRDEARGWIRNRMAIQVGYRLEKTLRAVDGSLVVGSWVGRWQDRDSGLRMRSRGIELLTLQDGLVKDWDAVMFGRDDVEEEPPA